jgi:hypothetical protein
MWARLGRFLEIYGPKFWDFQWKSDFRWKSSDYETRLLKSYIQKSNGVVFGRKKFSAAPGLLHPNRFQMIFFLESLTFFKVIFLNALG